MGAWCAWLGRDPETGADVQQPAVDNIAALVSEPRRYGFHATLKPPMRLSGALDDFLRDATLFCREQKAFALPPLAVTLLGRFMALCPTSAAPRLHALADACVASLDAYRLPEDAAAQARRAAGRTETEVRNLTRWGYPL